jgi:catechol 2,3-dioxygenase-like lactoylglutathione lyase family enzyme
MIKSIDHIVLTAQNIEQTITFYCDVLEMQLETFAPLDGSPARQAFKFGNQKINLHDAKAPYVPHAKNPTSGAIDICFLSDLSIQEWIKRFGSHNIPIENGPVQKTGATGPLMSIYVRDPDGSLIEISNQI